MPKTIYLVDASTFIHRSYHAIRNLSTKDGRPTNAVFGFVATMNKLLKERKPEYLAVAYDAKGPSFRKSLYPEYKANRPPMPEDLAAQQEPIRKIVDALGLKSLEIKGLEADDIIAALATQAQEAGFNVIIVSGDKDYYQMLNDRVSMYDPNPKRESAMDMETFKEKFGVTPAQFLDVQGLMGDSTDNIPGVPGVGEKTALKLINEYGSIDNLFRNVEEIKQVKLKDKLIENKDSAYISMDLARLKTDADVGVDIADLKVGEQDSDALLALYQDLEFIRFASELEQQGCGGLGYDDYHLVTTGDELDALIKELSDYKTISVDLETTSLNPMTASIVGISLSGKEQRAFYIPVGHTTLGAKQISWEEASTRLKPLLESETISKVGQNIKYDYIILKRHGVNVHPITGDPMIASYLLEPGAGGHNLDALAMTILGHKTIKYEEVVGSKKIGFDQVPPEAARDYACEDADVTLILAEKLNRRIEEAGLTDLYRNLELPLINVLAEMEMNGVALNTSLLSELSIDLTGRMAEAEKRIYELAGRTFNINSPKQLGQVLFEDLGLPQGKKTKKKSGYSTDVEVLTELAEKHELPAEILNFRSLTKLKSTYVDALSQLINPETGRVHTSFNQAVTATGRLSSSDPNLQNIPIRTEEGRRIREAFIARPGWKILAADYSQVELRVLAHYSGDKGLQDAFISNEDIHTRTASEVFGLMPAMITPDLRREAKAINFGIVYGQQAFGLARQLGIERKKAQDYIDAYFERYSGVKAFIDNTLETARETGFVTTLMGRRRRLPDLNNKNYNARSMAERMAVNTPIQGTAADIIKKAMIDVRLALSETGLRAKMLLQVHDELVFEVPEEELEKTTELVRTRMENVVKLDVPLIVDVSHGDNWSEAH